MFYLFNRTRNTEIISYENHNLSYEYEHDLELEKGNKFRT